MVLQDPGVFNAASNLHVTVRGGSNFHTISYETNDSVAGNEIIRLTGGCMAPLVPAQASISEGRLPTSVQTVQVLFNGEAAPLLSVQASEILAIVPQDMASSRNVTVSVHHQGVQASVGVNICRGSAWHLCFIRHTGRRHQREVMAASTETAHPASAGSIACLYVTGAEL